MDTIEGNKLIAKFMEVTNEISDLYYLPQFGHYFNSYGNIEFNDIFRSTELKYHSSWDWLMPVVEKIKNTIGFKSIDECSEKEWYASIGVTRLTITSDIQTVWYAVINYIKWYNAKK